MGQFWAETCPSHFHRLLVTGAGYLRVEGGWFREVDLDLRHIRRHGARWRVEKSIDGEYRKRSFDTLEAAIAYRDDLLAQLQRDKTLRQATVSGRINVGELVDRWFNGPPDAPERGFRNRKNKPLSPNTVTDFERRIRSQIPLIAHHDVLALIEDPLILETFLHEDLTPENARKMFTILNLAFKAALRGRLGPEHRIPANPCAMQELPPTTSIARGIPTFDEVTKILTAAAEVDRRLDLFCRLTATLGTRRAETCALRVNDFDAGRRRVNIDEAAASSPGGGLVLKAPKSWEPRTLLIPNVGFWSSIGHELDGRPPTDFLFPGWVRDKARRTEQTEAKCWHPSSASHRFAELVSTLGLVARDTGRPYTLHSLRHLVATVLYNRTHDWVQVAKFLGHKSPAITMRLYANHVMDESQRQLGEIAAAPWWGEGDALDGADVE